MSKVRFPFMRSGFAFVLVTPLGMGLMSASTSQPRGLQSLPPAARASISAVLGRDSSSYPAIVNSTDFHADNPAHALAVRGEIGNAKLTASDAGDRDNFGGSVAIEGDIVVVGMSGSISGGDGQGAYVFVQAPGGWSGRLIETAKLTASDGVAGDGFGGSVAISGDTIVVGAGGDDIGGNRDQGSAYVFLKPAGGWGGTLTETAKLTASDGRAVDIFGGAAISGDTVVVGAQLHDIGGHTAQGAAYIFVEPAGGWGGALTETAKLTASDGTDLDRVGSSVAISGGTVVLGAIGANTSQGSAYVFVEPGGGWGGNLTETAKLTASDGMLTDRFGVSVAISGDTVAIGAYTDDVGGNSDQGSAYVFIEPGGGWGGSLTETAKLTASDGEGVAFFGAEVAISGDMVVVGAYATEVGGNQEQGLVYAFREPAEGWGANMTETGMLVARDGAPGDWFGWGLAIDGDSVVVGANRVDIGAQVDQGAAYVFERQHLAPR